VKATLVLAHSPLVSAIFWQPAAEELRRRGWKCVVPTVAVSGGTLPSWNEWPARLIEAIGPTADAILVGHSAAGLLLPALAQGLSAHALIFVDAQIPPASGKSAPADTEFLKFIRSRPLSDGRLPRWSDWWGRDALSRAIPDAHARDRFQEDEPRLTPQWFEDWADVPSWDDAKAAYVQTSAGYSVQAEMARSRGWPVIALKGTHLQAYVAPREVARAIEAIATTFVEQDHAR
jgi:hypothetical protein